MTPLLNKFFLSLWALFFFPTSQASNVITNKICTFFKQESRHVAYLLDKNGEISEGPIEYGKWTDDGVSDDILIPTRYKLLIFPARTEINNNGCFQYGCLKLTKTESICKGVAAYDVEIRLMLKRKQKIYQFEVDTEFLPLQISDPKEENDPELIYKFKPRIKGKVNQPN